MTYSAGGIFRQGALRLRLISGLVLINLSCFAYFSYHLYAYGYLPSPFIPDKADTFMDLFHPMYWSAVRGRYLEWGAVYPPLNFVFLSFVRFLAFDEGSFANGFELREHAGGLSILLFPVCVSVVAFVVSRRYWSVFTRTERLLLAIAAATCVPMLFALERANLVVLSLIFLSVVMQNRRLGRVLAIAALINIKPYFVVLSLLFAAKKKWGDLMATVIAAGVLFFLSGMLVGSEFVSFFENIFSYSQNVELFSPREVMAMPSSVSAFSYVLNSEGFSRIFYALPKLPEIGLLATFIEVAKWAVVGYALIAIVFLSELASDKLIISVCLVIITNLGVSVGGYTTIFYIVLLPVLFRMNSYAVMLMLLATLFLPLDLVPLYEDSGFKGVAYLTGETVVGTWALSVGSIVRPLANLCLLATLALRLVTRSSSLAARSRPRRSAFH